MGGAWYSGSVRPIRLHRLMPQMPGCAEDKGGQEEKAEEKEGAVGCGRSVFLFLICCNRIHKFLKVFFVGVVGVSRELFHIAGSSKGLGLKKNSTGLDSNSKSFLYCFGNHIFISNRHCPESINRWWSRFCLSVRGNGGYGVVIE